MGSVILRYPFTVGEYWFTLKSLESETVTKNGRNMNDKYIPIKNDFNDIDNIINNPNHVVRRYYGAFLDGNYGEELFNKNKERFNHCTTSKKLRSFVINSFIEYNALDYGLTPQQVQRWLVNNIGLEKLEQLNVELAQDVKDIYAQEQEQVAS